MCYRSIFFFFLISNFGYSHKVIALLESPIGATLTGQWYSSEKGINSNQLVQSLLGANYNSSLEILGDAWNIMDSVLPRSITEILKNNKENKMVDRPLVEKE